MSVAYGNIWQEGVRLKANTELIRKFEDQIVIKQRDRRK